MFVVACTDTAQLAAAASGREALKNAPRERVISAPAPVLAVLKRKVSAAQDGLAATKTELATAQDDLTATKNELELIKKEAEAHKNAIQQLKAASDSELAVVKGQLAANQSELAAAQDELDASKKQAQDGKHPVASLIASVSAYASELDIVKSQLAATQDELATAQDSLGATKIELEVSRKEVEAHKSAAAHITASASELAVVKDELTAAKSELDAFKKNKKEMAIKNFSNVSKKNGEIAVLKKGIDAMQKEAVAHQCTTDQLTAVKADLEASKSEVHELNLTVTQLTAEKKDIVERLTVTSSHLEVCMKEAQDTASELFAIKAELDERQKMTRPQKHLSNQITTAKKELEAATQESQMHQQESQMHQQDALAKFMDAVAANHQLAQYHSAYEESQRMIAHLEAKVNSSNSTQARIGEALRTTQHELASAKGEATVAAQDLAAEKKATTTLAAESSRAQATITDLRSSLEIVKIELAAFKAPEPAPAKSAPAAAPPSAQSMADKRAAWGNAHALVRASDEETRRANMAKAEANKDLPAGEWKTIFRATGSALAKQSKVDAVRAALDGLETDLAAKDSAVAALNGALREERTVGAERKRELAAARLALESTQGSLRDARAALADKKDAAGCGNCAALERAVRIARADASAALAEIDAMHYKCMSTWAVLHDVTWDVEAKLSLRSGTPDVLGSTSGESDGSAEEVVEEEEEVEVEIVGGDGEAAGAGWDRNTPPHLRRGGFAGRSLARHMPGLVRK